jgi:hypothetical protein
MRQAIADLPLGEEPISICDECLIYPVAASDHRWQLTGKPRHQYQYDPFQRAWAGRL